MILSNENPEWLKRSVLDEVLSRAQSGDTSSFIYLVPTRARAGDVNAMLVERCAGKSLGGLSIMTPIDLASNLLHAIDPGITLLSDAEMGVFLELSVKRLLEAGALRYFERKSVLSVGMPIAQGTFEQILSTIRKLREHDVLPDQLQSEIERLEHRRGRFTEIGRAKDIRAIYMDYLELIGTQFVDTYGQFRLLRDLLDRSGAAGEPSIRLRSALEQTYPGVSDIFLEGFIRLEPSTYLLLRLLTDEVRIVIELPECGSNEKLFAPIKRLEKEAFSVGFVHWATSVVPAPETPGAQLRAEVTNGEITDSYSESIRITKSQDRVAEVEAIARQIKMILASDPNARANPSRICVASHIEREYTMLFRSVFDQYGIPASVTDRYRLEHAALTSAVIAVFELVGNGYRRRELRRVLASPYFRFQRSDGSLVDTVNLLDVAERERLSGSWKKWQSRLSSRVLQLEDEITNATDAGDERDARRLASERAAAVTALKDYAIVTDIVGFFEQPMRPSGFRAALLRLFSELGVAEAILRNGDIVLKENALERDARGYGTLVKLVEDLTDIFTLLQVEDDEKPLDFYLERLKTAAQIKRFTPRFDPGSVYVTSLEQTLGLEFDYLFIPGLVDGVFPSTFEPQVFLLSSLQQDAERVKLEEERMLFFTVITKFRKQLYLSWPQQGDGGAQQTRSSFLTQLMRALKREEEDESSSDGIFSLNALYEFAGSEFARSGTLDRLNVTQFENDIAGPTHFVQLAHAAQVQAQRIKGDQGEFTGHVGLDELSEEERRSLAAITDRTWSVSQLESYANCPFKFLTEGLFRFDSPEEEEEGFDKMEQGNLLHKVLYEIFTERREAGSPNVTDIQDAASIEDFKARANTLAKAHLKSTEDSHPFYRLDAERMLTTGKKDVWGRVLEAEEMLRKGSHRPAFFEVSFGSNTGSSNDQESRLSTADPVQLGRIKLRGKIDRIDMDDETFSIVDYKSGAMKSFKDIERGTSLQLLIYLKVAEELVNRARVAAGENPLLGVGSVYQSLKEGKRRLGVVIKEEAEKRFGKLQLMSKTAKDEFPKGKGVLTAEEVEELLERTIERAEGYVDGILSGTFRLAEVDIAEKICGRCGIRNACRHREAVSFDALPVAV